MKSKLLTVVLFAFLANSSQAQVGSIFKKIKDKEEKVVANDTAATKFEPVEEEKEEKKKGGGFFQKALLKVAKVASNVGGTAAGGFKTTNDLGNVEFACGYTTNLLSKDFGLASMDFVSGWKGGYDWISVLLLPKDRLFFYKLDGSIKVDGTEAKHEAVGLYSAILPFTQKDRKIEIATNSGQKATYTFKKPEKVIKLVSINNSKTNCQIDASKDFTIQLENISTNASASIEISLAYSVIGVYTTVSIGSFKPAANIVLPGYILKHLATDRNVSFKSSTLIVSALESNTAIDETGTIKQPLTYALMSQDAKLVSVINQPDLFKGLEVKGEENLPLGKINYTFKKPNAYFSRPQEEISKIAISSFSIQGKTDFYEEKTKKGLINRGDKTTTTISLPIRPEQIEPIINDLYPKFVAIIKEQYNVPIIPVEAVTGNAAFIEMGQYTRKDEDGLTDFSYSYKGLEPKNLQVPLAGMLRGETTLFKPLGVDAILKVNITLQLDTKSFLVVPTMHVELLGPQSSANFAVGQATQFFTADITGKGYEMKKNASITDQLVKDIVRADDMLVVFKKGMQEIIAAEKTNREYLPIWNLQK